MKSGFSIENIIPHPSKEAIEIFMQEVVKKREFSKSEKEIEKYFDGRSGNLILKNTELSECICINTRAHFRFEEGNTRSKIENAIINSAKSFPQNIALSILSIGSGGLLQDLIILFRLILNGYNDIRITCVEPEWTNEKNKESCRQFETIIAGLNQYLGTNIECIFYNDIDEVQYAHFDIIYAIDYDNLFLNKDYSSRQLPGHEGNFTQEPYKAAMAFIKGFNLNDKLEAFGAYSQGKVANILSVTNPVEANLFEIVNHENPYTQYCINASLEVLVMYLPFFIAEKKPLLINDEIMSADDKDYVEAMLDRLDIQNRYFNYANCKKSGINPTPNEYTLVVDGMAFDTSRNETPDAPPFDHVLRVDWNDKRTAKIFVSIPQDLESDLIDYLKLSKAIDSSEQANANINKARDVNFKTEVYNSLHDELDALYKDKELEPLLEKVCTIRRLRFGFAGEDAHLGGYLTSLINSNNFSEMTKAKAAIYCLKQKNYKNVAEVLSVSRNWFDPWTQTTGTKIWNCLGVKNDVKQPVGIVDIGNVKKEPKPEYEIGTPEWRKQKRQEIKESEGNADPDLAYTEEYIQLLIEDEVQAAIQVTSRSLAM